MSLSVHHPVRVPVRLPSESSQPESQPQIHTYSSTFALPSFNTSSSVGSPTFASTTLPQHLSPLATPMSSPLDAGAAEMCMKVSSAFTVFEDGPSVSPDLLPDGYANNRVVKKRHCSGPVLATALKELRDALERKRLSIPFTQPQNAVFGAALARTRRCPQRVPLRALRDDNEGGITPHVPLGSSSTSSHLPSPLGGGRLAEDFITTSSSLAYLASTPSDASALGHQFLAGTNFASINSFGSHICLPRLGSSGSEPALAMTSARLAYIPDDNGPRDDVNGDEGPSPPYSPSTPNDSIDASALLNSWTSLLSSFSLHSRSISDPSCFAGERADMPKIVISDSTSTQSWHALSAQGSPQLLTDDSLDSLLDLYRCVNVDQLGSEPRASGTAVEVGTNVGLGVL